MGRARIIEDKLFSLTPLDIELKQNAKLLIFKFFIFL